MERSIMRPPRLRTSETEAEEHRVTWLELFYDLVFVVAVASVGHRLDKGVTIREVLGFVGLFIPIWWTWAQFTFYADRYDTDDLGQRTLAVAQMIAVALMAVSISGDESESTMTFALAYVIAWSVLLIMYNRARTHVSGTRDLVTGYLKGFGLGTSFWLVSIFVPAPYRYVLWAIGLAISLGTPYYHRKIQARVPLDVSHLPERFGLFTILVLGESIAAVVAGLSHEGWVAQPTTNALLGVVIASGLWWVYFDNLEGSVVRRRPEQVKAWKPTAWIYSHLPLAISLVATGLGLEYLVAHTEVLAAGERFLVTYGMAVAYVAMAVIHVATVSSNPLRRDPLRARVRLGAAAVLLVLGWIPLGATPLTIVLAIIAVSQVAVDVYIGHQATRAHARAQRDAGAEPAHAPEPGHSGPQP
jgi:low temperature requirement protein LtrA